MIVLDTHAWLWWWTEVEGLSPSARQAIDSADTIGIAAISCWEVGMLASKKRIQLDVAAADWVEEALTIERILPLDLTPQIAVVAADLQWDNRDPADRIIVATAIIHEAPVVTRDRRIHAFPGVRAIW